MKTFGKSFFAVLAMGVVLFGCKPDNVDPSAGKGGKDVAGAFDAQHAALDTVCKYTDPIYFRSASGSFNVDKCIGAGGAVIACTGIQPKWGNMVIYNGYSNVSTGQPIHWLDVDFSLAGGWMCDFTNWAFVIGNGITVDPNTGLPNTTGSDWRSLAVNPYRNQWKVAIEVDSLPAATFDMACRMSILRLRLNGMPNEGTRTAVWAINHHYNETGSEYASNNEFAVRYTPLGCLATTPPRVDSVCTTLTVGAPALANCATLSADTAGAGLTYAWSTGATTETISVCPTATTTYSVTISAANHPVVIKYITVNYWNIRCTAGNSPQHKVRVCHRPPGNPTNVQNICIDWSGVPAHVARFRAPGSNPNQGHDSGCEIGNCGGNPCQN